MNKKPKYYCQNDPKWKSIPYTVTNDSTQTIGKSGCGITCMAMILATWKDPKITPVDMGNLSISLKDRTANQGTEWEFFGHVAKKYNMKYKQTGSIDEALKALQEGAYVVASLGKGTFTQNGHFIVLWNYDGKAVSVNDPASTTRSAKTYLPYVFRKEGKQYFIFYNLTAK